MVNFNTTTDILLWEKVLEKVPVRERQLVWSYSKEARRPFLKMIVITQILTANFMVFFGTMIYCVEGSKVFHAILGPEYEYFLLGIYMCMIFTIANAFYKLNIIIAMFMITWQSVTSYACLCEIIRTLNDGFDPEKVIRKYAVERILLIMVPWMSNVIGTIFYFVSSIMILVVTTDEITKGPPNFRTQRRPYPIF